MSSGWLGALSPALVVEASKIIVCALGTMSVEADNGRRLLFTFQCFGARAARLERYCAVSASEVGAFYCAPSAPGSAAPARDLCLIPPRPRGAKGLPRLVMSKDLSREAAELLLIILTTLTVVSHSAEGVEFCFSGSVGTHERLCQFGAAEECDEESDEGEEDFRSEVLARDPCPIDEAWRALTPYGRNSCALAPRDLPAHKSEVQRLAA